MSQVQGRRPGGAHQWPGLQICSRNVRSLGITAANGTTKALRLCSSWRQQGWDIVAVQDTKADLFRQCTLQAAPAVQRHWQIYWSHGGQQEDPEYMAGSPAGGEAAASGSGQGGAQPAASSSASGPSAAGVTAAAAGRNHRPPQVPAAGVAIFVSRRALRRGLAVLDEPWRPGQDARGRMLGVRFSWRGHTFRLLSVYLPNTQQRAFIATHIQAAVALANADGPGVAQVWVGDWNFVEHVGQDRLTTRQSDAAERSVVAEWRRCLAGLAVQLVDVYRQRNPGSRTYTHFSPVGAARLDRFYISSPFVEWIASARVDGRLPAARAGADSDHRPIAMDLIPRPTATPAGAPRRPRLRLRFLTQPALRQQFADGLAALAAEAPPEPQDLLAWWPGFKHRLHQLGKRLDRAARAVLPASVAAAWQDLETAHAEVEAGDPAALEAVLQRRQDLAAAVEAHSVECAAAKRRQWIHGGERPGPKLSKRLQPPRDARALPALRAPSGELVDDPATCAALLNSYFARISAAPATSAAAQQEVLAALGTRWQPTAEQAAGLGAAEVSEEEVQEALKRMQPGRAPGEDGIPMELYRTFGDTICPLLARLFSAVGSLRQVPRGFLDGLISVTHKGGCRADPANYRPLTLLNTDYRSLAKVLAQRLSPLLPELVDREQTGFVRGRSLGENIHLLQLLPQLLARQQRWAVVVFCDIHKAYDTVDRAFLLTVAERLGLGPGFLHWVRLLLTGTRARTMANGCVSGAKTFMAGVRQGCPLAPSLYLLVTVALLRLLKRRGLGVPVGDRLLTATMFADDTEVLLPADTAAAAQANVRSFRAAMAVFEAACAQRLSVPKTICLLVGAVPPDAPQPGQQLGGLQVVQRARALGVEFSSGTGAPVVDWPAKVAAVRDCLRRVAGLGLSAFGRGLACAGYAVSKILYHAECVGLPPDAVVAELSHVVAKLVDRGLAPDDRRRRFTGVRADLLVGKPVCGGFGVLPLVEHCQARHAAWLYRLVTSPADSPLVVTATALLDELRPGLTPLGLVACLQHKPSAPALPQPLARWFEAAAALPTPQRLPGAQPLPAGSHLAMPLWRNPLIQLPAADGGGPLAQEFDMLASVPGSRALGEPGRGVHTLGDLLHLMAAVQASPADGRGWAAACASLFGSPYLFYERQQAVDFLWRALRMLPQGWMAAAAAESALPAAQHLTQAAVEQHLAGQLGWVRGGISIPLSGYRVRQGTTMLTAARGQQRQQRWAAFVREALPAAAASDAQQEVEQAAAVAFAALLRRCWRIPWDNKVKEVYWRLALDGLPLAARMPGSDLQPCGCGTDQPGRQHHYWACSVAQAVVASVRAQLPPAHRPLQRQAIWLGEAPAEVHDGVWVVVCLAAVAAMDHGRKVMVARLLGEPPAAPGQQLAARAAARAVARLWELLQDFCSLGVAPADWSAVVPANHPFLGWNAGAASWQLVRAP